MTQALSSLPANSLSWRTSLLGDYENFAGLTTLTAYFLWFWALNRLLNDTKIEKIFYFNSLAAFLSSLYAIGQHYGFDFIHWNPESVNSTREFASLGNPNFLSAYLAMSIPLYLCVSLKAFSQGPVPTRQPGPFWSFIGLLGIFLLLLGTPKGLSLLNLTPSSALSFPARTLGLALLSITFVRLRLFQSWQTLLIGLTVFGLGLFSTASRGGLLGAVVGTGFWLILSYRKSDLLTPFRQKMATIPKLYFGACLLALLILIGVFGHSFVGRLSDSIVHVQKSLETSRLHIWRPAIQIIKKNPIVGVGLDTFKIAFPFYSGIEFNLIDGMFMSSRMAHNELLQVAATTGLLGLGAYLSVLLAFGYMWWKSYQSVNPPAQWLLTAVLASAVAYHVQNLFSFGVAEINFLWFIHLAIVQYFYRKNTVSTSPELTYFGPTRFIRVTIIVLLIFLILFIPLPRLGADIAFGRGSAVSEMLKKPDPQMDQGSLNEYSDYEIMELKKAVMLCPLDVKYLLYLGLAFEQKAQLDTEHARDWRMEALHCYQKSAEMSPANAYYYNDQGRIYNNLSQTDPQYLPKAEEAFDNAVKWAPASPFFILNWAMALKKTGQEDKAQQQIDNSFKLDRAFTSKVLAQMAFDAYKSGDKKTAFQDIDEAVRGNTSSAEAYYCRGILYLSEKEKKKALADFEALKDLHPTSEKNPSIQSLDKFIDQAKN